MTSPGRDLPSDLAARLFRALYTDYDLHTTGDIHIAVPFVPCYTGRTLSEIVRQVSSRYPPGVSPGSRILATGTAGSDDSLITATRCGENGTLGSAGGPGNPPGAIPARCPSRRQTRLEERP